MAAVDAMTQREKKSFGAIVRRREAHDKARC
jgi:hypothetical protein